MKLLITDDEYATRSAIKHLIDPEKISFDEIFEAENYEEAIKVIINHRPQIIVTDIVMPVHNGITLIDWILQFSKDSQVIAVSGHDNFSFIKSTLRRGVVDYLLKPLDIDELNGALQKAVSRYEQRMEYYKLKKAGEVSAAEKINSACHPIMLEVQKYIKSHYTQQIRQQQIADYFFINKEYLSRKFKQEFQISMVDYINQLRIDKAKELLLAPSAKVNEVALAVGFSDEKYFSTVFKKITGMSPKNYYLTNG